MRKVGWVGKASARRGRKSREEMMPHQASTRQTKSKTSNNYQKRKEMQRKHGAEADKRRFWEEIILDFAEALLGPYLKRVRRISPLLFSTVYKTCLQACLARRAYMQEMQILSIFCQSNNSHFLLCVLPAKSPSPQCVPRMLLQHLRKRGKHCPAFGFRFRANA